MKSHSAKHKPLRLRRRLLKSRPHNQAHSAERKVPIWPTLLNAISTIILTTSLLSVAYAQYRLEKMKAAPQVDGYVSTAEWETGPRSIDRVVLKIDQRGSIITDVGNSQGFTFAVLVDSTPLASQYEECTVRVNNYFERPDSNGNLEVNEGARVWMDSVENEMRLNTKFPHDNLPFMIIPSTTTVLVKWTDQFGQENGRVFEAQFGAPLRPLWKRQDTYEPPDIDGWYRRYRYAVFSHPGSARPACKTVLRSLNALMAPEELKSGPRKLLPRIF